MFHYCADFSFVSKRAPLPENAVMDACKRSAKINILNLAKFDVAIAKSGSKPFCCCFERPPRMNMADNTISKAPLTHLRLRANS